MRPLASRLRNIGLIACWLGLASCKPNSSNLSSTVLPELPNKGIGIGASEFTYVLPINLDLDSPTLLNPCIAVNPAEFRMAGLRYGQIDQIMQRSYSYDWLEANLEAQLNIEARVLGISVASAKVATKYRAANINTKLSYSLNSDFVTEKGTLYIDSFKPADNIKDLVESINRLTTEQKQNPSSEKKQQLTLKQVEFFLRCGDRFVHQVSLGSRFSTAVRVHFRENRKLLDFMVKAEAKVGGIKKKQRESETYDRSLTDSIVETAVLQVGGNQKEFEAFQASLGGDEPASVGSKRVRCFIDSFEFEETDDFKQKISRQLERCYTTWGLVNRYLSGSYFNQMSNATYQDLISLKQYFQSYAAVGILNEEIVLPPEVRTVLESLNEVLRIIAKLDLLQENTEQSKSRTDLAIAVNDKWKTVSDAYKQSIEYLKADREILKNEAKKCIEKLKKGEFSSCKFKSVDFSKYKDLQIILEDV